MLLNLCGYRILDLLIPLTNRVCDTGPDKVSPVYSAVFGGHEECLEMLLQHGYSPDAQMCLIFGFSSPMCMAFHFILHKHFLKLIKDQAGHRVSIIQEGDLFPL